MPKGSWLGANECTSHPPHDLKKKKTIHKILESAQGIDGSVFTLPLRRCSSVQLRKSNILTVPSSEQVASLESVGAKLDKTGREGGREAR